MELLTAKEAAAKLRMCAKTFRGLRLPAVRVDAKRYLYRVEDIEAWINSRLVYGQTETQRRTHHGSRVPKAAQAMGIPKVLSWQDLCAVSLGNKERS